MKNRIIRTKQFVVKHSHEASAVAGFAVGAAITYKIAKSPSLPNLVLHVTKTDLRRLIENPGSYVTFDDAPVSIELIVDHTN